MWSCLQSIRLLSLTINRVWTVCPASVPLIMSRALVALLLAVVAVSAVPDGVEERK